MKKAIIFICLIVPDFLFAQVTFNPGDLGKIAEAESESFTGKLRQRPCISTSDYKVNWYRCFWNIDPNIREISGNVTTLFKPKGTGLDSLAFDLNQVLTVDSVVYHSQRISWKHDSARVIIHFPSVIPQDRTDSVTVYYHGVPADNGFGSFVQSTHAGAPVIWTLSEPYGASDWWPCKNSLTDKADSIDIYISVPSSYKTASNGLLVSVSPEGANTVYHWKHRYPIATYLVCLAVTNYAVYPQVVPFGNDTLRLFNYVYPEDSANAASLLPSIIPMIQLYDSLFGLYPFQHEKYGHAEFGAGGGMEHQTMTFVNAFQFELVAHELAHQWFGDKVTCGSWTDIWLNEGFATYLSGLCYEHLIPDLWIRFREVRIKQITSQPGGSVYCADTTDISRLFNSRLSYAKGALILHQLRWIMGDSVFFAALNNYLNDFSLAYGFARTENLKSHLESSWGRDLTWYFDDWFKGEGYPQYQVRWSQKSDTVSFTLSQTQSSPTVSFFEMPVQLKFKNAVHDTMIRVYNSFSGELYTAYIPFAVDSVIFDPDYQIISGNNQVNAVGEHSLQARLMVYPVPASDIVTFRFGGSQATRRCSISVFDDSGRKRDEVITTPGQTEINLDTHEYSPGLYFYVSGCGDFHDEGKFLIIR